MSAGGAWGMVVNFVFFSVLWSAMAYAIDKWIAYSNTIPYASMDSLMTISHLRLIYIAGPLLYAIALGYNYVVTANSESSGEV